MNHRLENILRLVIPSVLVAIIVLCVVFFHPAGSSTKWVQSEADRALLDEQEAMARATHIIDAVYVGARASENSNTLLFKPVNAIKGELEGIDQERIYVQNLGEDAPSLETGEDTLYIKDKEYMLLLEKNISVYYDNNKYVQIGKMILSRDDGRWADYHNLAKEIAGRTKDTTPSAYGVRYSDASDVADLMDFSTNIFTVTVSEVYAESAIAPTTVYRCSVTKKLKGEPAENGNILITFFKETVKIGESYVVLLADASETAPVYTLSSRTNCVYPVEKVSSIPELARLLEQAADFSTAESTENESEILEEEKAARSGQ